MYQNYCIYAHELLVIIIKLINVQNILIRYL
jgi:hypothetical protein